MKRPFFSLCAGAVGCALALQFPATAIAKSKEAVILSFSNATGESPYAGLINIEGTLYGTTYLGGANCCGTVFALDATTGAETVLYSFCGQTNCVDGEYPEADLIDVKGTFYGTTFAGGTNCTSNGTPGCGTVFSLDPTTGVEKVLYSFCSHANCTDGAYPEASLIRVSGTLYSTTPSGGAYGGGTVFALDAKTGAEKVVHSFCRGGFPCTDGFEPFAGLIDVNGTLYGTTLAGGAYGAHGGGTVFTIDPKTGTQTVVHSFGGPSMDKSGTDGAFPLGSLINVNGTLYGTTSEGGGANCQDYCGTVFALDATTGAETVLHSFGSGTDGGYPEAGLIDMKGTLYGTTAFGGANCNRRYDGCGTVFSVNPTTGTETVLHSFCSRKKCADGAYPFAGLIDVNGTLYGTTVGGGTYGNGTVFALRPDQDQHPVPHFIRSGAR
jgi:uncharacterized repeat protein (TIGR03803 family)